MDPNAWILSYRDYYGTYHNHKETQAYTAAALYLGATAVLLNANTAPSLLLSVFWATLFAPTFWFVRWQFAQRRKAAAIVAACTTVTTRWLATPPAPATLAEIAIDGIDGKWPAAIASEVTAELKRIRDSKPLDDLKRSEKITYSAMALFGYLYTSRTGFAMSCIDARHTQMAPASACIRVGGNAAFPRIACRIARWSAACVAIVDKASTDRRKRAGS